MMDSDRRARLLAAKREIAELQKPQTEARRAARREQRKAFLAARKAAPMEGQRQPREHDKGYLAFIRRLPCVATLIREGREAYGVHAAHVRHSYPHPGWGNPGLQQKPDDWRTLPLAPSEHAAQHAMNEGLFYAQLGLYPPDLCRDLRETYPDIDAAKDVLRRYAGNGETATKTETRKAK